MGRGSSKESVCSTLSPSRRARVYESHCVEHLIFPKNDASHNLRMSLRLLIRRTFLKAFVLISSTQKISVSINSHNTYSRLSMYTLTMPFTGLVLLYVGCALACKTSSYIRQAVILNCLRPNREPNDINS